VRHRDGTSRQAVIGIAREHNAGCTRETVADVTEQRGAIHAWHPHIGNHNVEAARFAGLQRGFASHRKLHIPTFPIGVEHPPDAVENLAFVVDE